MADEVRIQGGGPNGEGLKLDLQNKKVAFTGKDGVTLLLIAVMGAGMWLRSQDITHELKEIGGHLQALYQRQDTLSGKLEQQNTLAESKAQQQSEKVTDQSAQLIAAIHEQTKELTTNRLRLEDRIERGMDKFWAALVTLNENLRRTPEAQLPLAIPPPPQSGGQR